MTLRILRGLIILTIQISAADFNHFLETLPSEEEEGPSHILPRVSERIANVGPDAIHNIADVGDGAPPLFGSGRIEDVPIQEILQGRKTENDEDNEHDESFFAFFHI